MNPRVARPKNLAIEQEEGELNRGICDDLEELNDQGLKTFLPMS